MLIAQACELVKDALNDSIADKKTKTAEHKKIEKIVKIVELGIGSNEEIEFVKSCAQDIVDSHKRWFKSLDDESKELWNKFVEMVSQEEEV